MSTVIPQRDLRNRNTEIIERVCSGESFVVTRHGVPVADVTPHVPGHRPPRFRPAADASVRARLERKGADAWLADLRALRDVTDDAPTDPWNRAATDG